MPAGTTLNDAVLGQDVKRAPDKFYPSIQGLRGFSAFSVIFVHIYLMSSHAGFFPDMPKAVASILDPLGYSTGLFFVISGFVIPASLFRHRDLKRFFIDRLLRIMPVYVVFHLLIFGVGPFIGYKWLRDIGFARYCEFFLTNLTFTALPLHLPLAQQNSWTLTYEWAFYILVGAAWLILARAAGNRSILILFGIVAVALCIAFPNGWAFLLGLTLNRFRPTRRLGRSWEVVLVPICLVLFYAAYSTYGAITAMPFASVIFWAVLQEDSFTSRFLCLPVMQLLGKISYSLYLVHPLVMFAFVLLSGTLIRHGLQPVTAFAIFAAVSLTVSPIVAAVTYDLLEVRLRIFLADRIKSWQRGQFESGPNRANI